jgi:hypothetical protein
MQNETEKDPSSVTPHNTNSNTAPFPLFYSNLWDLANSATVAVITSAGVVTVQSPVKTMLMNLTKNNSLLGGSMSFFRAYAGTVSSLSSTTMRTAYITTTKTNKPEEKIIAETINISQQIKFRYVLTSAFGDIFVTQIPESLSQLRKIPGLLPSNFKWHTPNNIYKLMFNGFTPRYCSGVINFTSMLQFESWMATKLPIQNKITRHSTAGAFSGMLASLTAYPFSVFKDYVISQATVNEQGHLVTQNSYKVIKNLFAEFTEAPAQTVKAFFWNASKQLPIRVVYSGVLFSLVAGIGEFLGPKPLERVVPPKYHPPHPQGFFSITDSKAPASDDCHPSPTENNNPNPI